MSNNETGTTYVYVSSESNVTVWNLSVHELLGVEWQCTMYVHDSLWDCFCTHYFGYPDISIVMTGASHLTSIFC